MSGILEILEDTFVVLGQSLTAESCCAFQGAAPPTKFGLVEMYAGWKPNWILGAVQKSHV